MKTMKDWFCAKALKMTTLLMAFGFACTATAAYIATNDFETTSADFVADDSTEDASVLKAYSGTVPTATAQYPFKSVGSKYLSVDSGETTLWCSVGNQSSDTFFDAFVQFVPVSGEIDYGTSCKLAVCLDAVTSNLVVISGTAANDRTPKTNSVTKVVQPNAWHRLTINAKYNSDSVFTFQVLLDGEVLKTAGDVDTFYSLATGDKVSSFGLKGTGSIDNFVARSTQPTFGDAVATIGDEDFATYTDAIAVAEAYKTAHGSYPQIAALDASATIGNDDWKIDNGYLVPKTYVAQIGANKYETLAAAVAAASNGDTINVFAGTFEAGSNTITIDKSVTITGAGKDTTTLNFTAAGKAAFSIAASNVTIENMTIRQPTADNTYAISVPRGGSQNNYTIACSNAIMRSLAIVGGKYAINVTCDSFTIDGCDFSEQTGSSQIEIYSYRGDCKITNNTFVGDGNNSHYNIMHQGGNDGSNLDGIYSSGTLTISGNKSEKVGVFYVFNQWGMVDTTQKMNLIITGNEIGSDNYPHTNKGINFYESGANSDSLGALFNEITITNNAFYVKSASNGIRPLIRRDDGVTDGFTINASYNYWAYWGHETSDFNNLFKTDGATPVNITYKPYYIAYDPTTGELSDLRPLVAAVVTDSGATTNNYSSLQAAVDAAYELTGDVTVALLSDTAEKVKINQKDGLDLTVDGDGKTVTGQLLVYGKSSVNAVRTDTLTIKGFNFTGTEDDVANNTAYIMFEGKDYAHNITITNCTFTSEVAPYLSKPAMKGFATSINNIKMYDLHAEKVHSFAQIFDATNVVIAGCSLSNSKNGLNLNLTRNGTSVISDTSIAAIDSEAYGVRLQGSGYGVVRLLSGVTIDAAEALVAGNTSEQVPLNNGNFLVEDGFYKGVLTQKVANCTFYITGGYFSEVPAAAFIAPGYTVVDNTDPATKDAYPYMIGVVPPVAEAYDAEGGTLIGQFATVNEAIAAAGAAYVKLLDNVTLTAPLTMTNSYTLDFNGKTNYYNTTATTQIKGNSNIIFKNGTLDISGAQMPSTSAGNDIFSFNADGNTLTFDNMELYGYGYGGYSVFWFKGNDTTPVNTLNFENGSSIVLKDEAYGTGGVFKGPGAYHENQFFVVNITGSTVSCTNVYRFSLYGTINVKDSTVTFTGGENAFRQGIFTFDHATVTVSGANAGEGKGLVPRFSDTIVTNGSALTFIGSNIGKDVFFEYANNIVIYDTSTVTAASVSGAATDRAIVAPANYVLVTTDNGGASVTYSVAPAVASVDGAYYATFAEAIAAADEAGIAEITILDGTTVSPDAGWKVADGKLVKKTYVAQIGETKYETLAEAFAAANATASSETITIMILQASVSSGAATITHNLLIDTELAGGATINFNSNSFTAQSGAVVTFSDAVTAAGNVDLNVVGGSPVVENAKLVLNNTVAASGMTVDVNGGEIVINPTARVTLVGSDSPIFLAVGNITVNGNFNEGEAQTVTLAEVAGEQQLSGTGGYFQGYFGKNIVTLNNTFVSTIWVDYSGYVDYSSYTQYGPAYAGYATDNRFILTNSVLYITDVENPSKGFNLGGFNGVLSLTGSRLISNGSPVVFNAGDVANLDVTSSITAKTFTNNGVINIDATGIDAPVKVIDYTGSGAKTLADYGTVNVTGGEVYVDGDDLWVKKLPVAQIGETKYETLAAAIDAAVDGDTIELLTDIELDSYVNLDKQGTYVIDGKGHAISMADGATFDGSGILGFGPAGIQQPYSVAADKNYTLKNVTVTGFDAEIVRCEGVSLTFDNCAFINNSITQELGRGKVLLRIASSAITVTNCEFTDNSAFNGIYIDEQTTAAATININGNLFSGNTISGNGIVQVATAASESDAIVGNTFSGNTLESSENVAVLYISAPVEDVSGNLFSGNTITTAASKKEGVIVLGSGATNTAVNNNAFVDNTLGTTASHYATIYTGADCNISGNYWGDGAAPEVDDHKDVYDSGSHTIVNANYAVAYKVNANGRGVTVTLGVAYTATFTLDETAPTGATPPASITFWNNGFETALPTPDYTSENKTFAGWSLNGDVVAAIPAGTTGDITLVATWAGAQKIQIVTDESAPAVKVEIKVTDVWLAANNLTGADDKEIEEALEATEANGKPAWQNYVLGLNGKNAGADVGADAEQGGTTMMPVDSSVKVTTVDTGLTVTYQLDEVSAAGAAIAGGEGTPQDTPDLAIDLSTVESNAYYKVIATIKSGNETLATVASTNVIGVLAVANAPATTIVAVPWESITGGDISVSNLVRTANLTPGDTLKAYTSDGNYKAWELQADKTWKPVPVAGGSEETAADAYTVPRGAGVWLTRADPSQPIYLVGDASSSGAVETPLEAASDGKPSWNVVASPSVDPVDAKVLLDGKEGDQIIVLTAGAPKNYVYVDGKGWGYWTTETVTLKNGKKASKSVFKTDDTYVPAGTGFWYLNSDTSSDAKIDW